MEETLQAGASVAVIARRHDVNANQVFTWRKLHREGRLGTANPNEARLLPVNVGPATMAADTKPEADPEGRPGSGHLRIECAKAHLIIEGSPDARTLRLVLEHLLR